MILHNIDGDERLVPAENIDYVAAKSGGYHHGLASNVFTKAGALIEVRESLADIDRMRNAELAATLAQEVIAHERNYPAERPAR